ncbi:glucose-1-phosphate adenylyltransferase subunit GlgD [Aerococcus sp. 1KP-2016]|uniref:glucose-1-phosphate adenylyltransferase subunit GlgD n=1 Tax=Aerococcus sp. 1KP-2016 TaxID=1981982 RepID=UPI000B9802F5|nr:glucose-1-phosphate adenylyltransferase subunit GlgD [Aerococcus sp. 1KP-2016]OYQ67614.1 glucose-1-phosphate adenylyltransferase subunit GlgD [Aerococcus sp. 1KP-2016]
MFQNKVTAILNLDKSPEALMPLTENRSIANLPFACRYRILDFYLSTLANAGIRTVALFMAETGRSVYDHIRSGKAWNFDSYTGGIFTFSQMNHKRALYEAASRKGPFYDDHRLFIERSNAQYVFVSGAKIVANVHLDEVMHQMDRCESDLTRVYAQVPRELIEYHPNESIIHFAEDGCVDRITKEGVTPINQATVKYDLNMTLIRTEKLLEMIEKAEEDNFYKELDEVIVEYMGDYRAEGYQYEGYVGNIDSIKSYYDVSMQMLNGEYFTQLFQDEQPIITKAHNGSPTYYGDHANVINAQIGTGCQIYGEVAQSHIFRNVEVAPNAKVDHSIIYQGAKIGKGATVQYAILDKSVEVEPGAIIIGTQDDPIVIPKGSYIAASDDTYQNATYKFKAAR